MKKILFAASESVPFIKTGGLADVIGSLPKYFDKEEYDVRVVLPKYMCIPENYRSEMEYISHFYMYYNGRNRYVGILKYELNGIPYYFIGQDQAAPIAAGHAQGLFFAALLVSHHCPPCSACSPPCARCG